MAKKNLQEANVDDFDIEAIEKKFEMLNAEEASVLARNYGAPDAKYDDEEK